MKIGSEPHRALLSDLLESEDSYLDLDDVIEKFFLVADGLEVAIDQYGYATLWVSSRTIPPEDAPALVAAITDFSRRVAVYNALFARE